MLQTRVIPVLLLGKMGMVKTIRFKQPRYVGDVVNAVRLFNDKEVDELVVLDIEATAKKRIQFELIEQLASEVFMPLTYGGGITSVEDVAQLLRLGVEKVVLNAALFTHPELLSQIAKRFGASTVIASVDFKKIYGANGRCTATMANGLRAYIR
jgi:imidazole glycerol phosphate synthase subunit hisF (EC 4.1.3.-)